MIIFEFLFAEWKAQGWELKLRLVPIGFGFDLAIKFATFPIDK